MPHSKGYSQLPQKSEESPDFWGFFLTFPPSSCRVVRLEGRRLPLLLFCPELMPRIPEIPEHLDIPRSDAASPGWPIPKSLGKRAGLLDSVNSHRISQVGRDEDHQAYPYSHFEGRSNWNPFSWDGPSQNPSGKGFYAFILAGLLNSMNFHGIPQAGRDEDHQAYPHSHFEGRSSWSSFSGLQQLQPHPESGMG